MGTKAIFFDIDGTLWDEKFQIPESTKKAFEMLKNNGHLTFICSGRTLSYIQDERLLALGFDCRRLRNLCGKSRRGSFL